MTSLTMRRRLRAAIARRPRLWGLYRGLRGRLLNEPPPVSPIHQVLTEFAGEAGMVRFVQVGSNDAAAGDPIMDFVLSRGWRGLLVEPVPYVYERLLAFHGRNPRFQFENLAIGEQEGPRTFYCLEPLDKPLSIWYDQMGSFSREHIEKHERFTKGLSEHIREITVQCLSLSSLLRKHGIAELDLLHVDAEGHDFEVLRSLDFGYCTPGLVLFEHGHLPRAERAACIEFLEARGYRLLEEGRDCLALHDSVRERWPAATLKFDVYSPAF
jgi:FkbM family methyltransferase